MKHAQYILLLTIFLMMGVIGCKDYTTQPNLGKLQLTDYFSTPKSATQFVNGIYDAIGYNSWWQTNFMRMLNTSATDNAWLGNIAQWNNKNAQFAEFRVLPTNGRLKTNWQYIYQAITRANIAIEKFPRSSSKINIYKKAGS